jgi:polyferredoxin
MTKREPGRQRWRRGLILISFLLFPLTIFYFSPVLVVEGAFKGIVVGSLFMFALQWAAALVLGRGFCGWVCPGAGLQEPCFKANARPAGGRWGIIKWVLWVPWVGSILAGFFLAGGITQWSPLYQTTHGISVADVWGYIPYYIVVGLIAVLALSAGKRAFCHYVCWMAPFMILGVKLQRRLGLPALRLKARPDLCRGCGRCTRNCGMSLPVDKMAGSGDMYHPDCILCGVCLDGCPRGVIGYSFSVPREGKP